MILKVTNYSRYRELQICANNGEPVSAQNPIDFVNEVPNLNFPLIHGGVLVISGMPMSVVALLAVHYKNFVNVLAIANPRAGVAEIIQNFYFGVQGLTIPLLTPEEKEEALIHETSLIK